MDAKAVLDLLKELKQDEIIEKYNKVSEKEQKILLPNSTN